MERRRTPRAELRGRATVQTPDMEPLEARLLDVGIGGMALISRSGAPPGYLRIRFRTGPQSGEFDVAGRVVRERHSPDHTIWGVQFLELDLGTRVRLKDYVARSARVEHAS